MVVTMVMMPGPDKRYDKNARKVLPVVVPMMSRHSIPQCRQQTEDKRDRSREAHRPFIILSVCSYDDRLSR
jgi:hypothetical protein